MKNRQRQAQGWMRMPSRGAGVFTWMPFADGCSGEMALRSMGGGQRSPGIQGVSVIKINDSPIMR